MSLTGSQEPEGDPIYSVVNLNTETRNRAATQAVPTPRELDRNVGECSDGYHLKFAQR